MMIKEIIKDFEAVIKSEDAIGIDFKKKALIDIMYDKNTDTIQLVIHNEHFKITIEKVKKEIIRERER